MGLGLESGKWLNYPNLHLFIVKDDAIIFSDIKSRCPFILKFAAKRRSTSSSTSSDEISSIRRRCKTILGAMQPEGAMHFGHIPRKTLSLETTKKLLNGQVVRSHPWGFLEVIFFIKKWMDFQLKILEFNLEMLGTQPIEKCLATSIG